MDDTDKAGPPTSSGYVGGWTFLSNHTHVLVCLARDPRIRLREVAAQVDITERAVQRIISELVRAGVITRLKKGRVNRYRIHREQHLRHPIEAHRCIGELLDSLAPESGPDAKGLTGAGG